MKPHRAIASHYLLYFAWIVAVVATLGSLYFSEILQYTPCELCWFQRIFMSIMGGAISAYHYMLQKIPGFAGLKPCTNGVPCNVDYINWLGFVTIPFLALIAFMLITLSLLFLRQSEKS